MYLSHVTLANPEKIFNLLLCIIILSGFTSDLAKKSGDPVGFRTISAGTTLLVHTVQTGKKHFVPIVNLQHLGSFGG